MNGVVKNWLPPGKRAALCFSIDDIHPARTSDYYEAGGDLDRGVLGRVRWLLDRHPQLKATLFVTADWREISARPTRRVLAALPYIRDRVYLARRWPEGTMSLDRHPDFVTYLNHLAGAEVGLHGLHHCSRGLNIPVEFQHQTHAETQTALSKILTIFERAGLEYVPGMCPPGWNAPPPLLDAMVDAGMTFVASARDIFTPVSSAAVTGMSGFHGLSLIYPARVHHGRLLHFSSNFNATCTLERAVSIIDCGGLLAIKAHAVKYALGLIAFDGLDEVYANYLDLLLSRLEDRYGDELWWTSMGEMARRLSAEDGGRAEGPP